MRRIIQQYLMVIVNNASNEENCLFLTWYNGREEHKRERERKRVREKKYLINTNYISKHCVWEDELQLQ